MLLLDGALLYSIFYSLMINTVKPGFRDIMVIVTTVAHTYEPLLSIFFPSHFSTPLDIQAILQSYLVRIRVWGSHRSSPSVRVDV